MTEVHQVTIADLLAAFGDGLSAAEVTKGFLGRIAENDAALRSCTAVDADGARAAARESAVRWRDGTARALEGVPIAVKANIAVRGLVTHAGTAALAGEDPAVEDASAAARLRAAGAVILGHLNMHEAALGATSDNPAFGRAINPWLPGGSPGGSSGGSGAAVAAGLCAAALGSDTLGSVRIPASYCGLHGLKPSNGLISGEGVVPLAERWDTIGPLGRSPDCVRRLLMAMANPQPAPPIARVALLSATAAVERTPAIAEAYARAQETLRGLSVAVQPVVFDLNLGHIRLAGFVEAALELAEYLGPRLAQASPGLNESVAYARSVPADVRAKGRALIAAARERLVGVLAEYDAVLTPTTPHPAHLHEGKMVTTAAHFTAIANIAGVPALAVPAGLDEARLPVSVQLIGRAGEDLALIDLAERLVPALGGYRPPPAYA